MTAKSVLVRSQGLRSRARVPTCLLLLRHCLHINFCVTKKFSAKAKILTFSLQDNLKSNYLNKIKKKTAGVALNSSCDSNSDSILIFFSASGPEVKIKWIWGSGFNYEFLALSDSFQ